MKKEEKTANTASAETSKTAVKTAPKAAKKSPAKKKNTSHAKNAPKSAVKTAATKSPAVRTTVTDTVAARKKTDVNPDFTDAFIQEVNEDVKNDNFKELWKKYGVYIVAIVVIAVSAAVSFDKIRTWKIEQNQFRTESYMAAAQRQSDPENTIAALKKIAENENGILGDFAQLQIANVLLEQQKTQEALAALEKIFNDGDITDEVRHIALIKYATYKIDTLSQTEFKSLLTPMLEPENSWTPLAQDLLAMSAIRAGDIEEAKKIYTTILKAKNLPDNFRNKIQDMLSSLSNI